MGSRELAVILGVMPLHGCWGRAMSPVQACFLGSLGRRTSKSRKDDEICCGYKAGGTAGVKEVVQLKRLWRGWLHEVGKSALAHSFFGGETKNKTRVPLHPETF